MIVTETFIKSVRYWIRNAMSKEAAYDYLNRLLKRRANVRDDVGDITFVFHLLPLTSSFKRRPLVDPRVVTLKYSHVRAIRRSCERTPHVTYSVLQQRFLSFDDLSRFSGVPPPTTTTPHHPTHSVLFEWQHDTFILRKRTVQIQINFAKRSTENSTCHEGINSTHAEKS